MDFFLGIRSGSFAGTCVQDERATLDERAWTTDLSAAIDCLLGLNPNDKAHASMIDALARFNGHFFRLRSQVVLPVNARNARADGQELPTMCTWAPLCSVLAHGGHAVSNLHGSQWRRKVLVPGDIVPTVVLSLRAPHSGAPRRKLRTGERACGGWNHLPSVGQAQRCQALVHCLNRCASRSNRAAAR